MTTSKTTERRAQRVPYRASAKPPPPRSPEPAMVRTLQLSREVLAFLAVTGVLSVAYLGLNTGDKGPRAQQALPAFSAGKTMDVSITLITADATGLACASDEAVGNAHCAFKYDGKP